MSMPGARYNYFGLNIGTSVDTEGVEDLSNGAGRKNHRARDRASDRGSESIPQNNLAPAVEAVIDDVQQDLGSRELTVAADIPKKVKK